MWQYFIQLRSSNNISIERPAIFITSSIKKNETNSHFSNELIVGKKNFNDDIDGKIISSNFDFRNFFDEINPPIKSNSKKKTYARITWAF